MALAINDRDEVVGLSGYGYIPASAVVWKKGVVHELETPSGYTLSFAISINSSGTIVGVASTPNFTVLSALLWQDGQVHFLPPLGSAGIFTQANGINDKGQIIGTAGPAGYYHAVLWDNGDVIDLGTLGGLDSDANAINNKGQIVGWSQVGNGDLHPAEWQNGEITDLGNYGSDPLGYASSINNQGQIIGGSAQNDGSSPHALLWQDGTITDLQTVVPSDSGWVLLSVNTINNRGQIAGWGTHDGQLRAFVLTPTPAETP
jgi:probable HAF family extracellular repeat protein